MGVFGVTQMSTFGKRPKCELTEKFFFEQSFQKWAKTTH